MSPFLPQPALKLKTILEQRQVHQEGLRTHGFYFCNDETQILPCPRLAPGCLEILHISYRHRFTDARLLRNAAEVGLPRRCRGKSSYRQQALIVENDVNDVFR